MTASQSSLARPALALLVSVGIPAGCLAATPAAGGRPNIVFIMADDHGANALGCYNPQNPDAQASHP